MQESRTLILITFVILMKISIIFLVRSRWAIIEASGMSGRHAYIRNPLLRTVYSRMLEDERERSEDHSYVSWLRFRRMSSCISISFEPNIFLSTERGGGAGWSLGRHPLPATRWPLPRSVRILLECILV